MTNRLTMKNAGWIFFVSYVTGIILSGWMRSNGSPHHDNLFLFLGYVAVGQIILNVLPAVIWCRYRHISLRTVFRLHKVSLKNILLSLVIYALSQIILLFFHQITEVVSVLLGASYKTSQYPVAESLFSLCILLLSIGIIPPICEELLFRGVLITGYARHGIWFSAVMSSFLFALFHDNPYRLIELFGAALVSSLLVIKSGSIIPGMIVHLITNSAYVVSSYLQSGDMLENISTPGGPGAAIIWITGAASIVAFMICWRLFTRFDPSEGMIEQKKNGSSPLRYFGWSLPIVLSIAVFIIKVN
ncbi:type II CAAX endopeptidase family protein [Paenibacillus polygoni]|uniref:Type II CAAX endopeptidase family protein n=1 Tax=Paenibacillus polygoni TaxID=3050112 RepID=A0ABY8WWL6_9BACL|nr:type II CAAX endopeptidase family protein [Paenibacillus polygoni]WIV17332.1 type II CAAX endopeptidase family protein [Paenibacillus polygoni]